MRFIKLSSKLLSLRKALPARGRIKLAIVSWKSTNSIMNSYAHWPKATGARYHQRSTKPSPARHIISHQTHRLCCATEYDEHELFTSSMLTHNAFPITLPTSLSRTECCNATKAPHTPRGENGYQWHPLV